MKTVVKEGRDGEREGGREAGGGGREGAKGKGGGLISGV